MLKLRECFKSLDYDGNGTISIDEIKGPLIGLGLVDNMQDVERLFKIVDTDNSGTIEFREFLHIINKKQKQGKKAESIKEFFKNFTNNQYQTNGLNFNNWVLT